ncbi:MAG: rRNA maturation RNase YbeY [Sedimentisphaerales bacterium]|nr:rRNA maturation RNase YbeY [Sedimentisphaerales bacterium]
MGDIKIEICDGQNLMVVNRSQMERTVTHVLNKMRVPRAEVSLAFVNDDAIRQLKQRYFNLDEITDVISFDLGKSDGELLDCEIVVNTQCAVRVAARRSLDPAAELNLYVVHGLLHQLGFDDSTEEQSSLMHQKEDELLEELGFGKVFGI